MRTVKIFGIIFLILFTVCLNASKSKKESIPFIPTGPTLISHNKYAKESQKFAKVLTPIFEDTLIANELKEAFNGERPLYIMNVTRDGASIALKTERLYIENIISLLSTGRIIYDDSLLKKQLKSDSDLVKQQNNSTKGLAERSPYEIALLKKNSNDIFWNVSFDSYKDIVEYVKSNLLPKYMKLFQRNWGIIVFNEMFFGKESPYEEDEYKSVISEFIQLSRISYNKIYYVNILGKIKHKMQQRDIEKIKKMKANFSSEAEINLDDYLEQAYTTDLKEYFENATTSFCYGKILSKYRKGTYWQESDDLINKKIPYFIGFGKDQDIANNLVSHILLNNVSTEICRDLAFGVKNSSASGKLHIFQSNSLKFYCNTEKLNTKIKNVLHSDPALTTSSSDFFSCIPILKKDEEVKKDWVISGYPIVNFKFKLMGVTYSIIIKKLTYEMLY